ncbi:hypothetical protein VTH06DRAFT_8780 [Thermothelomyces fergusii]
MQPRGCKGTIFRDFRPLQVGLERGSNPGRPWSWKVDGLSTGSRQRNSFPPLLLLIHYTCVSISSSLRSLSRLVDTEPDAFSLDV